MVRVILTIAIQLVGALPAFGQTDGQLWGTITFNWLKTRSRDTTEDEFSTSDNIVSLRVKRVF